MVKFKTALYLMAEFNLWVSGGSPIFYIEYIAFTCYPPRSETSHNGGLVGLLYLRHISHVHLLLWLIVKFYFKEILLRRLRGYGMCCL